MRTGVFFAMSFLTNLTTTDLVTIPSPTVIESYGDIIARNAVISFQSIWPEHTHHANSPPDTLRYKLFRNRKEVGATVITGENSSKYFRQEMVAVARRISIETAAYMIWISENLDSKPKYRDARGLIVEDPKAFKFTNVFLFSNRMKGKYPVLEDAGLRS